MTSHKRLSPGVEFNEIDKSQYGKSDYSIVGTASHIAGFADIGQDYVTKWVNTKDTFYELYGYPTNEVERYFFNGVCEVLDRGGVCYATKLPYQNAAKDKFATVTYSVELSSQAEITSRLQEVDRSLTSYLDIKLVNQSSNSDSQRIAADTFDNYRTGNITFTPNQIKIVDITRGRYGSARVLSGQDRYDIQCLGVVPVLVGSVNSMFFRGLISSQVEIGTVGSEYSTSLSSFQPVSDFAPSPALSSLSVYADYPVLSNWNKGQPASMMLFGASNFSLPVSAATIYGDSVGKRAVDSFPAITTLRPGQVEQKYTKRIGLAVFVAFRDDANEGKISFKLVEAFSGQLDRRAVDENTGASDYICDKVNQNSQYVNMFSTVRQDKLDNAKATFTAGQKAISLGFFKQETYKHIDYAGSIVQPLSRVLDRLQDPNQIQLDLMVDAGLANIAQFISDYKNHYGGDKEDRRMSDLTEESVIVRQKYNADMYPFIEGNDGSEFPWTYERDGIPSSWYAVMQKLDDFCKNVRKDCIFIADGFRPFVLSGNEKLARLTNVHVCGTAAPRLISNIRKMTVLDSSYSAGYSNWFYCPDYRTGEYFWCPPSIKAAGVYTYNDAYGHVWSAPAGMTRGVVVGAADVAFNPYRDEAGEIYKQAWNYAVSYPLEGVVMEGQKTMQLQQTALDRVNVRRLMLYLERMVVNVARRFLYEGNTSYNRQRFVDQITPIFDDAVQGDGVLRYAIRCDDELNNTEAVENHEMRCIIGVVPVKTMEWIVCNFVIGNQSADVHELVMK